MPLTLGTGFLLLEVLGVGGAVAITAGLLLTTGFHTGVRRFVLHVKTLH